jgi:MFS family permease
MRRVNALTFLNNFVSGALTLLIPLLLLAWNVTLADIGIVLSVLPLVFLVARLLFAAIADRIGWSHIFLLINWPATFVSTLIYYVATSLPAFLAGKVVEGLRESSYWAVSRTAIFHLSPKREGDEATRTNAIIWLATAIGSAAAGVGIAYLGFSSTIAILMLASATVVIPAGLLWKTGKKGSMPKTGSLSAMLNPKGKGTTFWLVSVTLMFNSLATYPLITLLLPVFMDQQLGYSYFSIGLLFMFYNLIASAITLLTLKTPLNFKRAIIQTTIGLVTTFLLANSGLFFPVFLCALALIRGFSVAFFEHLVAKVAKNSKSVSVDIGLLHVPMRFAEFFSVLTAGFVAQAVGYAPVFAATGIFFAAFSFLSLYVLRAK